MGLKFRGKVLLCLCIVCVCASVDLLQVHETVDLLQVHLTVDNPINETTDNRVDNPINETSDNRVIPAARRNHFLNNCPVLWQDAALNLHTSGWENCQKICQNVDLCTMFRYDMQGGVCSLRRETSDVYYSQCVEYGSAIGDYDINDPCAKVHLETCSFTGESLEFLSANSIHSCEYFCDINDDCENYFYNKESGVCQLFGVSPYECTAFHGPRDIAISGNCIEQIPKGTTPSVLTNKTSRPSISDIFVGGCDVAGADIVYKLNYIDTADNCELVCKSLRTCDFYKFDEAPVANDRCTLYRGDYQTYLEHCTETGGPSKRSPTDPTAMHRTNCVHTGEILETTPLAGCDGCVESCIQSSSCEGWLTSKKLSGDRLCRQFTSDAVECTAIFGINPLR